MGASLYRVYLQCSVITRALLRLQARVARLTADHDDTRNQLKKSTYVQIYILPSEVHTGIGGKRVSPGRVPLARTSNHISGKPLLPDLLSTLCGVKLKDFCIWNRLIRVIR